MDSTIADAAEHSSEQPRWHNLEAEEAERRLGTGRQGLSSEEAATRLERHGPNELEEEPPPSWVVVLLRQFASPLIFILLVATAITLVLEEYVDAGVIAAVLALNALIGFVEERRAERAARALNQLVAQKARVVRDAREREIPARELVVGDLVLLESGTRVPADLRLSHVVGLRVDESLLTGESVPADKSGRVLEGSVQVADRVNMAYAGSVVATGRARGITVATGMHTELGAIAEQIRAEESPKSPLQVRMARLGRLIGVGVTLSAVVAFIVGVSVGNEPAEMFTFAVAMAVAAVPEGLPVVLSIALALGVRRMAKRNALVRRLFAVETLGSTTVIATDKTGTLTLNRMTVQEVWSAGRTWAVGEGKADDEATAAAADPGHPLHRTLLAGVLANEAHLYLVDGEVHVEGDPTETALLVSAVAFGLEPEELRDAHDQEAVVPFESERQYSASVNRREGQDHIYVKGAPERVVELCEQIAGPQDAQPLDAGEVLRAAAAMADRGMRVLAMAELALPEPIDRHPEELLASEGMLFLGLQGMIDPPRPEVAEAVAGCRRSGIRPIMITGDHAATAGAIAAELGIGGDDPVVLTGVDLDELSDEELREKVRDISVFARVTPQHKLRVVQALRAEGEVVAVTGDGVNDGPALKAADIGVAMGRGGTDVAREASDMVLADDNFASIYAAVEEGRATFDNVRKVTFFLLSTGVALIIALLAAFALGWPVMLAATQILWLNLVTNGLQDVALAFEPGEPDVLERPPRPQREGVISRLVWARTAVVSSAMAAAAMFVFRWELDHTGSLAQARTASLTTLVLAMALHLGNVKSERFSVFRTNLLNNRFLFVAAAAALGLHAGALYLPATQFLLKVEPIDGATWGVAAAVALSVLIAGELHKAWVRWWGAKR